MENDGSPTLSAVPCGSPQPRSTGWAHPATAQSARGLAQSKTWRNISAALAFLVIVLLVHAQQYSIDWYKVAGGGGTSTGGVYSVSGTIGQHDAGGPLTGGSYSLSGGFWTLISVVQTPGLPDLTVTHSSNSVIVSWPDTGAYTLQQNSDLANSGGWTTSGYAITIANGTNSITIHPPSPNHLFFRLKQ